MWSARPTLAAASAFVVWACVALASCTPAPPGASAAPAPSMPVPITLATLTARSTPDVVLIVADDMNPSSLRFMPRTRDLLADKGVRFSSAQSATPTCCPARSALMTGKMSPKTGVWTNWAPEGGWPVFHEGGFEQSTIATMLDSRGYRTGLFGKYLNGYSFADTRTQFAGSRDFVPPGWDSWSSFAKPFDDAKGLEQGYSDYWLLSREGSGPVGYEYFSTQPDDYSTDVLSHKVQEFISSTPRSTPLLAVFAPLAPHAPFERAQRHAGVSLRQVPGADTEALKSRQGKPSWLENRPVTTPRRSQGLAQRQAGTLLALDEAVADVVSTLQRTGRLANTLIVFVSDNGLGWGEFGVFASKNYPYNTDVPLVMRWDSAPSGSPLGHPGRVDSRLVTLADVPVTVMTATGATPPADADGIDLASPARREYLPIGAWRNRGGPSSQRMPAWCGVRTLDRMLVRYSTGFEEAYDLARDPEMLVNLASSSDAEFARLRSIASQECQDGPPNFDWDVPSGTAGVSLQTLPLSLR